MLEVRFPIAGDAFIPIIVDVVNADIPLLIGLNDLKSNGLLLNYLDDRLEHRPFNQSYPVKYKYGHLFFEWNQSNILFTRHELQRLHLHFLHPTTDKLFQLLKRIRSSDANEETKKTLEAIAKACEQCQEMSVAPFRFRASIPPDQLLFNQEVAIDLMWLENTPVLHVVDTHTGFQNATVVRGKSADDIWLSFVECWATLYTGYPNVIRLDQEAGFAAETFRNQATVNGVRLQFSGAQSHNSIGIGERYHEPLRRVFSILRRRHPTMEPEILLRFAIKGLNDTMGPNGLVPSLLVFGTLPTFPMLNKNIPGQKERMDALRTAREEVANIRAEQRVEKVIKSNLPPAVKYKHKSGDRVYAFSEKQKKWISNLRVVDVEDKNIWINDGSRKYKMKILQVIPQKTNEEHDDLMKLLGSLGTIGTGGIPGVCITEVLTPNDPRRWLPKFDDAKRKEIKGLIDRKAFQVVLKEDVPPNANILGGRFVLAIKNVGTKDEVYKARFVVQGHTDAEKNMLVHNSSNVKQQSIRLLIGLSAIFGFRVWTQDVSQAYLQSASELTREVYVKPKGGFILKPNELLRLLKPLYGLTDSGDYWHITMTNHLKNDLKMTPLTGDLACFIQCIHEKLQGMIGIHVDDSIGTGNKEFVEKSKLTERRFESKPREYDNMTFAGINITKQGKSYLLHQSLHASRLKELPFDCDFERFRARRHEIARLTHTRPDLCARVALMSRVTTEKFNRATLKLANSTIKMAKEKKEWGPRQHDLDKDTLRILAFSDSRFANYDDMGTQLGYAILMTDHTKRVNWLTYASYKCRRIVRSVLGGETYAFADCFDAAYSVAFDLQKVLGRSITITMQTDSESLFKTLVKSSTTAEKRLMIDIRAAREAFERREITNIGWIRSKANIADGLTKLAPCGALEDLLQTGELNVYIEHWIERANPTSCDESSTSSCDPTSNQRKYPSVNYERDIKNTLQYCAKDDSADMECHYEDNC